MRLSPLAAGRRGAILGSVVGLRHASNLGRLGAIFGTAALVAQYNSGAEHESVYRIGAEIKRPGLREPRNGGSFKAGRLAVNLKPGGVHAQEGGVLYTPPIVWHQMAIWRYA